MLNVGSVRIARLLPGSLISTHGSRHSQTLYLTFDDGPHPSVTERLCDLLGKHDVTASFFCIGENLRKHRHIAERLVAEGHSLHNHSDTHRNYRALSAQEQRLDLEACQREITRANPAAKPIFRAPRGQLSLTSLLRMRRLGWRIVHWSYDSLDYQKPTTERQLQRFRESQVRNGDILLFHDDDERCLTALDILIPQLRRQGFIFASIDELFD